MLKQPEIVTITVYNHIGQQVEAITEDDKYRFVNAAINAVKRYKYQPAEYKGIKVNQWIRINIYFRIENE